MLVGLDLRRASPRLRRWVTTEASTRIAAPLPLRRVRLLLRRGPSTPEALRALPLDLELWAVEVPDDSPEAALAHLPSEGVAPAQAALAEAPEEDVLRLATGISWWLVLEGDALVASARPPSPPGGTPGAGSPAEPSNVVELRRAA